MTTTTGYDVQGRYSHGWETVTGAETFVEAKGYLKDYRENEPETCFRIVREKS